MDLPNSQMTQILNKMIIMKPTKDAAPINYNFCQKTWILIISN